MTYHSISRNKQESLKLYMKECGLDETDIDETFVLSSGKGGQKQNKSASAVRLYHRPTQITVKCGASRHQELNRYKARYQLCDAILRHKLGHVPRLDKAIEKIRKQKKRRKRRTQNKND